MPYQLEAMDSQRFHRSKSSLSAVSIDTRATSGHNEVSQAHDTVTFLDLTPTSNGSFVDTDSYASIEESLHEVLSGLHGSSSSVRVEAMDAQRYDISKSRHRRDQSSDSTDSFQASSACSSPSTSDLESDSASSNDDSLLDSTTPSTDSSASSSLEEVTTASATVDKVDHAGNEDEPSTTHTIIRPLPRSPIIEFFSRPSSPVTRPNSPLNFATLSCFSSTAAFEDDVDYVQAQRAKELSGQSNVRVYVTESREIHREELWRGVVQSLLYGDAVEGDQTGSVISRGG
ncbi:hypothetical protein FPV67DRAFT_516163 [Lyophyllum atratum]|nr:hypothetical protein FPV67DRAFT_516163 [Lyophyllum atratum]